MTRFVAMVTALALIGCGKVGKQYQPLVADPDLAEPGEFRETWETSIEVPGHPPRVEEKVDTHCLKGGDEPVRKHITERFAELCKGPALRFADGQIGGTLNCRISSGDANITPWHFTGTYEPGRVEVITQGSYQGAWIRQTRRFERLGDCDTLADAIARGDWSAAENREASD